MKQNKIMVRFRAFEINFAISYAAVSLFTLSVVLSEKGNEIFICLICSLLHEIGHLCAIFYFCGKPRQISINLGEFRIDADILKASYIGEAVIMMSGVFVNFSLCSLSIPLCLFTGFEKIKSFFACNLLLGIFNLLPIRTLDGGELLVLLLSSKISQRKIDLIMTCLTVILLIPLSTLGFYVLLLSGYNYSLLCVAVYLIIIIITKEMR